MAFGFWKGNAIRKENAIWREMPSGRRQISAKCHLENVKHYAERQKILNGKKEEEKKRIISQQIFFLNIGRKIADKIYRNRWNRKLNGRFRTRKLARGKLIFGGGKKLILGMDRQIETI